MADSVFIEKLRQCCIRCDFSDPFHPEKKLCIEAKRDCLNELIDQLNTPKSCLIEANYPEIIQMVSVNIFRKLPSPSEKKINELDQEEDEPNYDPSWPHLQLVYEFFLKVLENQEFQAQIAKKYIDSRFVTSVSPFS
jgi:serine/threonine-protein phosphatase 2A regulatory subunit B'